MSAGKGADIGKLSTELQELDPRYRLLKIVGAGSYGVVLKGVDTKTGEAVALKKISPVIFQRPELAKRILREVKLLAHFHKEVIGEERADNIIGLLNLITPRSVNFEELWIVMELADSDLRSILKSGQSLSLVQVQYMLYQILSGLKTMKAASVIHRDITPSNILVNYATLDIKICDFGLAREAKEDDPYMTDYVTMRWYRAPELVMESKEYSHAVDMWGVGCILAEMFGSKQLFRGVDRINQIDKIIEVVGSPETSDAMSGSNAARKYVTQRYIGVDCKKGRRERTDWNTRFPHIRDEPLGVHALNIIDNMLVFNPADRITVEEALTHPFLAQLHDEDDEDCGRVTHFDLNINDGDLDTIEGIKRALYEETILFHKRNPSTMTRELRAALQAAKQEAGSLAKDTEGISRTGFEGTLNPQSTEEDVVFQQNALPYEVDQLVDLLSSVASQPGATTTSAAQPLLEVFREVVKSEKGAAVSTIMQSDKYGWNGERFSRNLSEDDIRHLVHDIRKACCEE